MSAAERAGLAVLHLLDPERAHGLSIRALRLGIAPLPAPFDAPRLRVRLAGLDLANPLGLAAGYDKNAEAVGPLTRAGFGFVEVGAATPRPQPGNPRPRLFRLPQDRAVINRFGFNNVGAAAIAARLAAARRAPGVPVGLNLGANKDSADRAGDFAQVLATCGTHIDFATVNVSSPNTEGLRALQAQSALRDILGRVHEASDRLPRRIPVFLKIAPDLDAEALAAIAELALEMRLDAIIATNTTLARDGLHSPHAAEAGGLSGAPLFERSTRILARLSHLTEGRIPLIGVGGIGSGADAFAKISAGATALQIYTALVWRGLSLVPQILADLDDRLARAGHGSIDEAVGKGRDAWL